MNKYKIFEIVLLNLILMTVIFGFYLASSDLSYFEGFYVKEDGPLEWLSVVALLLCFGIMLKRIIDIKLSKGLLFFSSMVIMSLIFIFGIGEEISWGQRIFDIKSSEFFVKNNAQMETNIHNLLVNGIKINKLVFGLLLGVVVFFIFIILPILYRKFESVKTLVNKFAIPVPTTTQIISYLIFVLIAHYTPSPKKGELFEFAGCWILFLYFLSPENKYIYSTSGNKT